MMVFPQRPLSLTHSINHQLNMGRDFLNTNVSITQDPVRLWKVEQIRSSEQPAFRVRVEILSKYFGFLLKFHSNLYYYAISSNISLFTQLITILYQLVK